MITHLLTWRNGAYRTLERHDTVTVQGTQITGRFDRELAHQVALAKELARAELLAQVGTKSWQ